MSTRYKKQRVGRWWQQVADLFFPPVCAACKEVLGEGSHFLCTACQVDMPLTYFWQSEDNPIVDKFAGHLPFVTASALLYFIHDGNYRSLIHSFKYEGNWKYAQKMGAIYGRVLAESPHYNGIDAIVPIPLHPRKKMRRGYNQSEYIARGIAHEMGVAIDTRSVVRHSYNESQTTHRHSERWDNVEGIFSVRRPELLAGRHILLVDDVLTTGATIISCGEAIVKAVPDCKISIATLAVSKSELSKPKKITAPEL